MSHSRRMNDSRHMYECVTHTYECVMSAQQYMCCGNKRTLGHAATHVAAKQHMLQPINTCCIQATHAAANQHMLQQISICCSQSIWIAAHHSISNSNTLSHTQAPTQLAKSVTNTLPHTATQCKTLQHTATRCNTLQHNETQCNTLQHTAIQCNTL